MTCKICKTKITIPDDEHDDSTCLCGEEDWVEESK